MRELLDRLLEPDSENEIYDEIWGAYVAGCSYNSYSS